ncbi:MAG TPA: hypothetical protein VKY19_20790 [Ktedonosporobacter sp.]|nr:hypothetical protein [Ktedonosporobacter sp.]
MSSRGKSCPQNEKVIVTIPRELVQQLTEYDPETANLLGIDEYVAAICREWHGEDVIRKTKVCAEKLFFSEAEQTEDEAESAEDKQPYMFQVRNHQSESCGLPPHFDDPPGVYRCIL